MPRKYAPGGDALMDHLVEGLVGATVARARVHALAQAMELQNHKALAEYLNVTALQLDDICRNLAAAEAIRKEISPRRQAALRREAQKRAKR